MLKASQISYIINEIYDGVERNKLGIITDGGKDEQGRLLINQMAWQSFLHLLDSLVPKNYNMDTEITLEDKIK